MAWIDKKQLTVGGLIELLSKLDRNLPVVEEVYDLEWDEVNYLPIYGVELDNDTGTTAVLLNHGLEWEEE